MTVRQQYETAYRILRQFGRHDTLKACVVAQVYHGLPVTIIVAARRAYVEREVA